MNGKLMWFVAILSLIGVILNIYKLPQCFMIWAVTNTCWCARNVIIKEYPQAVLFAVYLGLSIWGLIQWTQ